MKRILVVDDNVDILETLKVTLEVQGYEIKILSDPAMIFTAIKKNPPDLILLDVYLAGTNGIDICAKIKSKPDLNHIAIIMMSGHSNLDVLLQSCDADAFIEKPFDLNHMVRIIESQLMRSAK